MGSFRGHMLPGSLFLIVGVWHIFNSIVNYVSNPKCFRGKAWHPVRGVKGIFRYAELFIIASGSFIDMCFELFYSPHGHYFLDGALDPKHMNDFEHAAMLLMFTLVGVSALFCESTSYLPLPDGGIQMVAAMAFTAEYILFYFHSTTHAGIEGRYHELLVLLIGMCILFSLLSAAFPESFVVDLGSGIAIALQGLWFYATAMCLYGSLMAKGCWLDEKGVSCEAYEYEVRATSVAIVQLNVIVWSMLAMVSFVFGICAHFWGHPDLYLNNTHNHLSLATK